MEIELKLKSSDMQELIDVLNALKPVSNVKAQVIEKPQKKEKAPKVEAPKSDYTLEDLQKNFGELAKAGLKPKLKELLSKHEVTKVSELPADKYSVVMDELKALKGA
nr:MAG TPA: hypothetical protein [Caudoviricetes sp.]